MDAVEACHDRLTAQGIDLNSYNLAEMAADAEDLRIALGIDDWNILTYGTASAISFEILRHGGPATEAEMSGVRDIDVDDEGNVFFSDYENHGIRKVDTSGIITTVAGTGIQGFAGDGGTATHAKLNHPAGVSVDAHGNICFADRGNDRVRCIDRHGTITTVAGTGRSGYSGDGGPATRADLGDPYRILFDEQGNLYVASRDCGCIRMVDPEGNISTVAGTGTPGFSGDGGRATKAQLASSGMAFGPDGALYIADAANLRVRKVVFP